jgi:hypothetical protein
MRARTSVSLIVRHPAPSGVTIPGAPSGQTVPGAFRITGDLTTPLSPGAGEPLDLGLANAGSTDLSISGLAVNIAGVSAPRADSSHPCSPADFEITQFSGTYGFVLPVSGSIRLSSLGIPPAAWPAVDMLDTALNQDGCKGATLSFGFAGTATGDGT